MKVQVKNRYNKLKKVILCYPSNYRLEKKEINKSIMYSQYNNLVNTLQDEGVATYFLDPKHGISQVYTRDIAFVIDDILFISKMTPTKRRKEYEALERFIHDKDLKVIRLTNFIEGGDVILHDDKIFVGLSKGTSIEGINELQNALIAENKPHNVIPIRFNNEEMLHLDCVFNVLSKDSCLFTDFIYDIDIIKSNFKNCYHVEKDDAKKLGTNILVLGDNKLISANKTVCTMLSKEGFEPIYIDFSEFIKGSGAFTCVTLPIYSI